MTDCVKELDGPVDHPSNVVDRSRLVHPVQSRLFFVIQKFHFVCRKRLTASYLQIVPNLREITIPNHMKTPIENPYLLMHSMQFTNLLFSATYYRNITDLKHRIISFTRTFMVQEKYSTTSFFSHKFFQRKFLRSWLQ